MNNSYPSGGGVPSRPTIRPAQRQDFGPSEASGTASSAFGADAPFPSRRELRRREAAEAAAVGAPTAVYSDAPPGYAGEAVSGVDTASYSAGPATAPIPAGYYEDPQQLTQPMAAVITPVAAGAAMGAGGSGGDGGGHNARHLNRGERPPLGPVRRTIRTFGELCITAGLVLILFVVWQLWWTDIEANKDNEVLAGQLTQDWADQDPNELPADPDEPYVAKPVEKDHAFGIIYIPRFGDDYYRTVAEGVDLEPVLNRMGAGRYPNSAMPGDKGNFSVAGHRVTYGKPFNQIAQLRPGDKIVVQTKDGFYTYTFRNFNIILPDAVEVLAPVPAMPDYKGKDRIMTMTACNPMFSAQERYVAYSELTDWTPASKGAPDVIKGSKAFKKVSEEKGS